MDCASNKCGADGVAGKSSFPSRQEPLVLHPVVTISAMLLVKAS